MKIDFITTKVTDALGTRLKAFTLDDLKTTRVSIEDPYTVLETVRGDDGKAVLNEAGEETQIEVAKMRYIEGFLDNEARIKELFPDAEFHWVEWKEDCDGRDIEKAEAMQWRTTVSGQTLPAPWRYKKSWALALLKDWSYDKHRYPLTEQGFDNLPDAVIYLVQDLICVWKDATFPDFTKPLTTR